MAKSKAKPIRHTEPDEIEHEPEAPEVEDESQDHEAEASGETDGRDIDKANKASLVRAALAEGHTKPREGCQWIKETYGVEISGTYFSVAKSQQAKRSGEAPAARTAPPPAAPQRAESVSASPQGVPAGFGGDVKAIRGLLVNHNDEADSVRDLVATVDTLVRKYGVSGLNEMIDAFSK